jgi:thioredoxin reductase
MDWFLPPRLEKVHSVGAGKTLVVIGAGPAGIETALYGRALGFKVRLLEKGRPCENVLRWGHATCFTPWSANTSRLGLEILHRLRLPHAKRDPETLLTGRKLFAEYFEPVVNCPLLKGCVEAGVSVLRVGLRMERPKSEPNGFVFLIRQQDGKESMEEADFLVDCSGTYGNPRWLGRGGLPAPGEAAARAKMVFGLEDILGESQKFFAGKSVMVIGHGLMAAASVTRLAKLAKQFPATWVIWLAGTDSAMPMRRIANDPYRERDLLAAEANSLATRGEKHVEFSAGMHVDQVEWISEEAGFRLRCHGPDGPKVFEAERLICHKGFMPETTLLRELGVPLDPVDEDFSRIKPHPPRLGGFDLIGAKRHGRLGNYTMNQAFPTIRAYFARISKQPNLDLGKLLGDTVGG